MEDIILLAQTRPELTKGQKKSYRAQGSFPAIVYGKEITPIPLLVDAKTFQKILHGRTSTNALIKLHIPERDELVVMIKNIPRHPTLDYVLHVDLHQLSLKNKIEVNIPVQVTGKAAGVESGGMLEHVLWELKVSCLPTNIPENITLDVAGLQLGQGITVKDVVPSEGVTILNDPEQIIVHVVVPKVEEVAAPAVGAEAAAAVAEPVVIGKGKKPEEGEEGAAGATADKEKPAAKKEEKAAEKKPAEKDKK